jgi:hypothetical protein
MNEYLQRREQPTKAKSIFKQDYAPIQTFSKIRTATNIHEHPNKSENVVYKSLPFEMIRIQKSPNM